MKQKILDLSRILQRRYKARASSSSLAPAGASREIVLVAQDQKMTPGRQVPAGSNMSKAEKSAAQLLTMRGSPERRRS